MSTWRFDLVELDGITPIGTVQGATDRNLSLVLNGNATASFTIRLDNERAEQITTLGGDVLLKVYQDSDLLFLGELVSAEESGEPGKHTLACNFAGPLFRLQKRWIGTPPDYPDGYAKVDTPASNIIAEFITQTNAQGDSGVREGTIDPLYNTNVGTDSPWSYKPIAEALTNLQEAKVPFSLISPPPVSYVAHDVFGGTGGVDGRTDDEGNTWNSDGTGPDWTIGGNSAYMASASSWNQWAISDAPTTSVGPLLAGMDFYSSLRARSTFPLWFGLYVRLSGETPSVLPSGNWVRIIVGYSTTSGHIWLEKNTAGTGGTPVLLGEFSIDAGHAWFFAEYIPYSVRLLIDENGNYWVYQWTTFEAVGTRHSMALISGQHDDLAAGGALATGKLAWGNYYGGGAFIETRIGNVFVAEYTGPQSFDFEFVPEEHDAGDPGKLWTLNVASPQLGTTTTAVFEYGPSMKSYNRKIDRERLATEAACFSSDGSIANVRTSKDDAAIAARGRYQETIPNNDVSDGQLRQALADLNVQVRKQARQLITFEPTSSRAPQFGVDFSLGDYAIGRAVVNGTTRFDGVFRVYAVDVKIDENGKETVIPSLVPE